MLVMMYAHARFSGDGSLLSRHVSCTFVSFHCSSHSLSSSVQSRQTLGRLPCADYDYSELKGPVCITTANTLHKSDKYRRQFIDQETQNLTNLALKGIIGIQAMAEISRATGNAADVETYSVGTERHFSS